MMESLNEISYQNQQRQNTPSFLRDMGRQPMEQMQNMEKSPVQLAAEAVRAYRYTARSL